MHKLHADILECILSHATQGTKHTPLDHYFGSKHPRHAIRVPVLRILAKTWMLAHRELSTAEFSNLLASLVAGESHTEKIMAGIMLDYATPEQWKFDPKRFDRWLNHLEGWAEIDTLCTGEYSTSEILSNWRPWKTLLVRFSKSKNISKRRASIVLLCSPLRSSTDEKLADIAIENIERLKKEKDILITKAISWTLRSMAKHHRKKLIQYLNKNSSTLPKIAVRETQVKLKTGKKNG